MPNQIPEEPEPGEHEAESEDLLSAYFRGPYLEGELFHGNSYARCISRELGISLLKHQRTGIQVWAEVIDVRSVAPDENFVVLYHYTGSRSFLSLADRSGAGTSNFDLGAEAMHASEDGLAVSSKEPESFTGKNEVIIGRQSTFSNRSLSKDLGKSSVFSSRIENPKNEVLIGRQSTFSVRSVSKVSIESPMTALLTRGNTQSLSGWDGRSARQADFCIPILAPASFLDNDNCPPPSGPESGSPLLSDSFWRLHLPPECKDNLKKGVAEARMEVISKRVKRLSEAHEAQVADPEPGTVDHERDLLTAQNLLAELLETCGKCDEAEPLLRKTVARREALLGPQHPDTLTSIGNLGRLVGRVQATTEESETLLWRALQGRQKILNSVCPVSLQNKEDLAKLLTVLGKFRQAEPLLESVHEERQRILGPGHPATLRSVDSLVGVLQSLGRAGEAEPLCRRALESREALLGENHQDSLACLVTLVSLLRTEGRYAEAKPLQVQVTEASEAELGVEHPVTLASLGSHATLCQVRGQYEKSEVLYQRAVEGSRQVLGPEHPCTLAVQLNYAELLRIIGRVEDAEPLVRQVLEHREALLSTKHPDTLSARHSLAMVMHGMKKTNAAEELCRSALVGCEDQLGGAHPGTLAILDDLAAVLRGSDKLREAETFACRALAGLEAVLGQAHPRTLQCVSNLASLMQSKGDLEHTEPLMRRACEGRVLALGAGHPDTLRSQQQFADMLCATDRHAEALPLCHAVCEGRLALLGPEHESTLQAVDAMANVLAAFEGGFEESLQTYRATAEAARGNEAVLLRVLEERATAVPPAVNADPKATGLAEVVQGMLVVKRRIIVTL